MRITNPDWFPSLARAWSVQIDMTACSKMSLMLKKLFIRLKMLSAVVIVLNGLEKRKFFDGILFYI